mgnify:CR=1 FL=1
MLLLTEFMWLMCVTPMPVVACSALNEHSNFERFWSAALTLFKVATNDNWTDVMVACMIGVRMVCQLQPALLHACWLCVHDYY